MTETPSRQLGLALGDAAYNNQYLFADHYLAHILTGDDRWIEGLAEAEAFLDWLRRLYEKERDQLEDYIESQLRDHWFNPILRRLGHTFEREAQVPGLGSGVRQPDYVFFPNETVRQAAVGVQKTEDYAQHALAVGEVKAWETHLSKKRRGGGPSFDDQNPSYQIDYYLKATGLPWGILSNGRQWRLVHQESSYRLDTYYEVDLVALLEQEDAEALRYFTLFFRQAAFQPDARGHIFLDDVLAGSRAYAVALEEDLRENAYLALEHLMQGFYDYGPNGLTTEDLDAVYENSLYLLYRLLFVLYGESRGLLPMDNPRYQPFSFSELKEEIITQRDRGVFLLKRGDRYYGQLQSLFRLINGTDPAFNTEARVVRYNGGLFDPEQHPFLAQKRVGDWAFAQAVDLLCRRIRGAKSGGSEKEFADYRTLNVRHLGSIYEGLLEYRPRRATEAMVAVRDGNGGEQWVPEAQAPADTHVIARRAPGEIYLETDKGKRKATGSYYTPQYIVEYIVEQTLGPLIESIKLSGLRTEDRELRTEDSELRIEDRELRTEDQELRTEDSELGGEGREVRGEDFVRGVLDLKILDPAMGSGHFLVEATNYLARALATDPYVQADVATNAAAAASADAVPESDLTYWQRRVVERCIYGVDKNPLAVELAKLSLWLTTFASDSPLGFLDHHFKCGDSLVGAQVADLGSPPPIVLNHQRSNRIAEGQLNLFAHMLSERLPVVMGKVMEIVSQESDSYETVRAKEAADRAVQRLKGPFEAVANLWLSAYFGNEYGSGVYQEALDWLHEPATLFMMDEVLEAEAMAEARRFFHWELVFPEAFFDGYGQPLPEEKRGFDAVIGNPPYFSIAQLDELYRQYLRERYAIIFSGNSDILYYFLYLAEKLPTITGYLGFIVARYFQEARYACSLRTWFSKRLQLLELVDFQNFQIFGQDVNVLASIIIAQRSVFKERKNVRITRIRDDQASEEEVTESLLNKTFTQFERFMSAAPSPSGEAWQFSPINLSNIDQKLRRFSIELSNIANIVQSMQTGRNEILAPSIDTIKKYHIESELIHPLAKSGSIERYFIEDLDKAIIWTEGITLDLYPNLRNYLLPHKKDLASRYDIRNRDANWWEISNPRNADLFLSDVPRILVPFLATGNKFSIDRMKHLNDGGDLRAIFFSKESAYSPKYVCALLNSKLLQFYHIRHTKLKRGGYYEYFENQLNQLPIRRIVFTTPEDERARLLAEAQALYEAGKHVILSKVEGSNALLAFVDARLAAEPEQADVIHDLLAYLAEQMMALHEQRQKVKKALDPFKFLDRGVRFVRFTEAFAEALKYGKRLPPPSEDLTIDVVHHDIDGLRLVPDEQAPVLSTVEGHVLSTVEGHVLSTVEGWRLDVQYKLRDPADEWRSWQYEDDGRSIARVWVPVYRLPLDEAQGRYYQYAFRVLEEFTHAKSFPGGRTRTTFKKLQLTRVPAFDAEVDLVSLTALEAELAEVQENIAATDRLIDQIVYQLYGLTEEEIAVVEGEA
jgi:hypothetical protein